LPLAELYSGAIPSWLEVKQNEAQFFKSVLPVLFVIVEKINFKLLKLNFLLIYCPIINKTGLLLLIMIRWKSIRKSSVTVKLVCPPLSSLRKFRQV
jgi:hypothetical protein